MRLRLEHPDSSVVFRPCSDLTANGRNCSVGLPEKRHRSKAPWTALGYTFDWAPHRLSGYERFGESEFVIRKGASIEIKDVVTTMQYCATQQETTIAALR